MLTAGMAHSVNLSRFLCLIQFRSLVLFVLLFHCRGLVLSGPMVLSALSVTIECRGSIMNAGAYLHGDSVMWHGTMFQLDSLLHGGSILPYGSLIMSGTIFSSDSLCRCGAFRLYGSM